MRKFIVSLFALAFLFCAAATSGVLINPYAVAPAGAPGPFAVSDAGNGTSTSSGATVVTGSTVTATTFDFMVVVVSADNNGTNGAASLSSVSDSAGNTYTQRALINHDPGAAGDGATLGFFTAPVTVALSSGTVTANFSPNTTSKAIQVYKVSPGAGQTISFVSADTTGASGSNSNHTVPAISVTNGDTVVCGASIETDGSVTADSDTTNGSWSTQILRLAGAGSDVTSSTNVSQYKTVNATGDQNYLAVTPAARDSARTCMIIRSS